MDFTREPIVETIITPREGFRLVIRSSKNPGQEEFVVDALEVVSFGSICFYRHLERPRSFIVPASDYEVLEIREARMPLKAASFEGTVRQTPQKTSQHKEQKALATREAPVPEQAEVAAEKLSEEEEIEELPSQPEEHIDRRKDRKRGKRRRGQETATEAKPSERQPLPKIEPPPLEIVAPPLKETPVITKSFLPPPSTLIRDDIERLRKSEQYRSAFYAKEDEEPSSKEEEIPVIPPSLQEEEISIKTEEESVYKATPLPPEEEDVRTPLWIGGGSLGPDKP